MIFFEPNPFRSRLHVLEPLLRAVPDNRSVVVMPPRVGDAQWQEFRRDVGEADLIFVDGVSTRQHPGGPGVRDLRRMLGRVMREVKSGDEVCFTALDDWMTSVVGSLDLLFRLRRRSRRLWFVKYRSTVLFERPRSVRSLAIRLTVWLVLTVSAGRLVIFDERYRGRAGVAAVWPDPWAGDFGTRPPAAARERLGLPTDSSVIGLIGYQDARKGFPRAVRTLLALDDRGWRGHCLVLGRVDLQLAGDLAALESALGERLHHETTFVPDEALPDYFAACDVVLMPYDVSFSSTSGVLARAAASGVPVVTGTHGLVGHRVTSFGLGATAPLDDTRAWCDAVERLLGGSGFQASDAIAWAATSHIDRFVSSARATFGESS
jgi:glycosyltransferase involved in cell wall biosynthesis